MIGFDTLDKKAAALSNIRAIVHDPDKKWLRILAQELKGMGLKGIHEASNPKDALTLVRDMPVDVLVTHWDSKLITLLRQSKNNPRRSIPIILVTSGLQKKMVIEARDLGISELVAKPASSQQIYDHIENIITHPRLFIDTDEYVGPDRRRHQKAELDGPERRKASSPPEEPSGA